MSKFKLRIRYRKFRLPGGEIPFTPWCLFLACFFPVILFSQNTAHRRQEIDSHQHEAQKFLQENLPALAAREFRAILGIDPKNVDAHGNLGVILFFQGDYANAIPELRAALKLQPALPKIQALLGMAEKRTGDERAVADLEHSFGELQEKKIRIDVGMELIEIYSGTNNLDKAASIAGALREIDPTNVEILYAAYRIYSSLASETILSIGMVAPNSAQMHQLIAHEMAKHSDFDGAIAHYREALKINPEIPGLHFELAEMLRSSPAQKNKDGAEVEYKAALAVNPFDEQSECRLGEIAAERDDLQESYAHYSRAVQLKTDDPEAAIGLAKTLIAMNQLEKAQQLLEHAILLDPTSAVAHFRLGTLYRQAGRAADAQHEMQEYQKYKDMKEKLRAIYKEMRLQPEEGRAGGDPDK